MNKQNCRVCGFQNDDLPWGEDGNSPTFEICPCCGVEFGNEDYTKESTMEYRKKWIHEGARWFSPRERPTEWNREEQFKNIPAEFL
ncbi:hypothetical protein ACLOAU_04225 [Niabella sp. CJ426]|uniref:hypothetical protein n=1 Tax=Niabella sp. CJ426 TaxID=3393740 RepID=UPI003D02B19E